MIKYTGSYITFQEVPNEVSLVLTISGCPHRCPGCHSPWLQQDIGMELTLPALFSEMTPYAPGFTCVCFMGDGGHPSAFDPFIEFVHACGFKVCIYTGSDHLDLDELEPRFLPDYYKVGPYVDALGGLDHPSTNQHMYHLNKDGTYEDITHLFWKEKT